MIRRLGRTLPAPARRALIGASNHALRAWHRLLDARDDLLGSRHPMVPPRRLTYTGDGAYLETGREFFGYFTDLGGLQPHMSVLDVGCGMGRMAIPLTSFLAPRARYEGIDVVPAGIDWCNAKIAARHPNFHFQLADVRNPTYNPAGRHAADAYVFPFDDASFDFVFLTSVFTHLMPAELTRYIDECARVLKPGGRMLGTFFLLNDESEAAMAAGGSRFNFRHPLDGCRITDPRDPTAAVAYMEADLMARLANAGLRLAGPVRYGSWCGRAHFLSLQDIVVAEKPA